MVRLEIEMAIIGTVNELLIQGNTGMRNMDNKDLSMNEDIVFKYSRMIEARSGYAVVNGFSSDSLNRFFSSRNQLFQYDPFRSSQEDKPSYRLRIEELLSPRELPEGDRHNLGRSQINTIIGHMMDILDPSVNYPYDFLKDMKLLEALVDNEEDAHVFAVE